MSQAAAVAEPEGTPPVAPEEGDSPEYLQKMADRAANSESVDLNDQDSSLILGKFQDVDALAAAYKELESKLGQQSQQVQEPQTEEKPAEPPADLKLTKGEESKDEAKDSAETADESNKLFEEFGQKYAAQGELTAEDYQALEAKGYPKEVVQVYEAGLKAMQTARSSAAAEAVGGAEALQQVQQWAGQNLSDAELTAFNQQLTTAQTPEQVALIYETLGNRYRKATGEANLVGGATAVSRSGSFSNRSEMVAAMSDPRYGKDPAFTKEVEQKTMNSTFL